MANLTDEEFATNISAVKTNISEKDKNLNEVFTRYWNNEFATHKYNFDRQEQQIATMATITKAELQSHFEELLFQANRANRLDMHWNSTPHLNRDAEESKTEEHKAEDGKTEEVASA